MTLYQEILTNLLTSEPLRSLLPQLTISPAEIVEAECYQILQNIKAVLADDSLDDPECFLRIEKIVCLFEDAGSGGGGRHDFG